MPMILSEDDNSYEVQRDDGQVVRIAKAGLSSPLELPTQSQAFPGLAPEIQTGTLGPQYSPGVAPQMPTGGFFRGAPSTSVSQVQSNFYDQLARVATDPQVPAERQLQASEALKEKQTLEKAAERVAEEQSVSDIKAFNARAEAAGRPDLIKELPSAKQKQSVAAPSDLKPVTVLPEEEPTPERPSMIESAYAKQERGALEEFQAQRKQATKEAATLAGLQDFYKQEYEVGKQREKERQDFIAGQMKERDELFQKWQKSEVRDPWANASIGTQIAGAIAMGMGAFGAGMTGTPNYAMDIINKSIDRDVNIQLKNIDKMGDSIKLKDDAISQAMTRFNNEDQRRAFLKDLKLQETELKLKQIGSEAKGDLAQANYSKMVGQLQLERQKTALEFAKGAAEVGRLQREATMMPETWVPDLGTAVAKEDAKELRKLKADVDSSLSSIDEMIDMTKQTGRSFSPADRAKALTLQQTLIGGLRTAILGPGTISDSERAIMNQVVANPAAIMSLDASTRASLETLRGILKKKLSSAASASGIQNAEAKVEAADPKIKAQVQQQRMVEWAKRNRQDPRAQDILQRTAELGQ